jgi:hypothetical protein
MAFEGYSQLTTVNLGEGLEEIGRYAFNGCKSLHEISTPPGVKVIKEKTYTSCTQLTIVNLG